MIRPGRRAVSNRIATNDGEPRVSSNATNESGSGSRPTRLADFLRPRHLLAASAAALALWAIWSLAGGAASLRLRRAIAELERADPAWRWDDIRRAIDADNARVGSDPDVASRLVRLAESIPPADSWSSPVVSMPFRDEPRFHEAMIARHRRRLAALAAPLAELRALLDAPPPRFAPISPLDPDPFMSPAIEANRRASHALALAVVLDLLDGRAEDAERGIRLLFHLVDGVPEHHQPLALLQRAANHRLAARLVAAGLGEPGGVAWSDDALERLEAVIRDRLERFDRPASVAFALRAERAALFELLDGVAAGTVDPRAIGVTPGLVGWVAGSSRSMRDSQAFLLEWLTDALETARAEPWTDALDRWDRLNNRIARARDSILRPPFRGASLIPAIMLAPSVQSIDQFVRGAESQLAAIRLAIAAERHRRRTGDWPESPDALVPRELPRLPLDPFADGAPFALERLDDGGLAIRAAEPNRPSAALAVSNPVRFLPRIVLHPPALRGRATLVRPDPDPDSDPEPVPTP